MADLTAAEFTRDHVRWLFRHCAVHKKPPSAFSSLSFSTKKIRLKLHRDAKLTIAWLDPNHTRFALEGLVFKIEEKPDHGALGLKIPDVLISHVVPSPSFNCIGRASL